MTLSACYAPKLVGGAPCDPARDSCPDGQSCVASGGGSGVCTIGTGGGIDAAADAIPPDGSVCIGKGLLGSVCLQRVPTAPVNLTGGVTINTSSTTAGNCSELRPQASGPQLCVVAGTSIDIAAGATVRAIGPYPLVLVATRSITIEGALDASSHSAETIGGVPVLGAGARTALDCAAIGVDGQPGKFNNNNNSDEGGGGAAGGSFGATGGAGGTGGNGNIGHGNPVAATSGLLIGGCPGGHGGDGSGGGGGSVGGNAGGAVYLLAGDSIMISGKVNASGAGGAGGTGGMFSSGGGGGGGAGGMIGLDALHVTVTAGGSVFANGGGGGGGGGNQPTNHGTTGGDASAAQTAAAAGTGGSGGGGAGGAGSTGAATGVIGKNSVNNSESAGGGGGGGAGVIRVFGVAPASIGVGAVSPPAT
jgi:hypothetical protein